VCEVIGGDGRAAVVCVLVGGVFPEKPGVGVADEGGVDAGEDGGGQGVVEGLRGVEEVAGGLGLEIFSGC
jgi:hypothetical protein